MNGSDFITLGLGGSIPRSALCHPDESVRTKQKCNTFVGDYNVMVSILGCDPGSYGSNPYSHPFWLGARVWLNRASWKDAVVWLSPYHRGFESYPNRLISKYMDGRHMMVWCDSLENYSG